MILCLIQLEAAVTAKDSHSKYARCHET